MRGAAKRRGWRVPALLTLVAAVFVAAAVTIALTRGPAPASRTSPGGKSAPGGQSTSAGQSAPGAGAAVGAIAAADAARRRAAIWVSRQVSSGAVVSCDPAMCAALQAAGVPSGRLLALRPGQSDPLGSDIVAATAAVRSQFGGRLVSVYAPVTLASFGVGPARIDIRVVAPYGAAAYLAELARDVRARKAAGSLLARNPHVRAGAAVRAQLTSGQVDSRLLVALALVAYGHAVNIVGFGGPPAKGASPGVPLRSASITGAELPGARPLSLPVLRAFFLAQRSPYRPSAIGLVRIAFHREVLNVTYPAPSPLGLLR